ncbi:MAG: hypothetical protein ACLRXA_23015 [Clostridium sp.]
MAAFSAMVALMLAGCGNSAETADSGRRRVNRRNIAQESASGIEADAQTADGEPTIRTARLLPDQSMGGAANARDLPGADT